MTTPTIAPISPTDVARLCGENGFELTESAADGLALYLTMLCQWNASMNLTGMRTWQDMCANLVMDSFHLARFLEGLALPGHPLVWDLGAGAGLPGIPLRLVWQRGQYYMIEVRAKRALFISSVLARLRPRETHVFRGTVQDFFPGQPHKANLILSRAFMPWPELCELALPHVEDDGMLVIMANDAPPQGEELPGSCRLLSSQSYDVAGRTRWFWALAPAASAGSAEPAGREIPQAGDAAH